MNAAGLAIIVESWLNALVPNEQRGRVLTIYVLVYGLFYGAGQLLGQNLDVRGPELLFIAGIATTLALVPDGGDRRARTGPAAAVKLEILKALRTSPASVLACLLNGLILTGFFTVGPLFGVRIGFDQQHIVLLMACVSLGGLFLQWPIGYVSDKIDRLYALIGLGAGILAVAAALRDGRSSRRRSCCSRRCSRSSAASPKACMPWASRMRTTAPSTTDYVALSSTLLFVWALGAAIGPTTGTFAIQLISPQRVLRLRDRRSRSPSPCSPSGGCTGASSTTWSRSARNFSPIRRHRRKSTPGCPITARPLEKRWPAPRPAMPRRASRPPRNLNRPAPQPKE